MTKNVSVSSVSSDSLLSLSSALTVLKQEIPSPFGNDQVKKTVKGLPLNKAQVDEILQIEQAANGKNGSTATNSNTNGTPNNTINSNNNTNAVGGTTNTNTNTNTITCHLNGNSNSSTSNDLVNCLDNVGPNQQLSNDPNDEHSDSNNLSMYIRSKYSDR